MKLRYVVWVACACCLAIATQAVALEVTELTPETYQVAPLSAIFDDLEPYFADRAYTITLVPDVLLTEIEDKIAFWIKTGNDDKHNADENFITFNVDTNVWVYLAYDRRAAEPPDWVLEGFDDMEVDLGTTDVAMGLWRSKEQYLPGLVQLHGNDFGGAKGASSNYAAFVVEGDALAVESSGKLTTTWGVLKTSAF